MWQLLGRGNKPKEGDKVINLRNFWDIGIKKVNY